MVVYEFTLLDEETGQRLDHVVRGRFPEVPRRIQLRWFAEGKVRLDGRPVRKGVVGMRGQVCLVIGDDQGNQSDGPPLAVCFESDQVVVVDKPPGIATTALVGSAEASVAEQLLRSYPGMGGIGYGPGDAGLIHRLDTGTSGVVVAAKTAGAFQTLVRALRGGQLDKTYLAWTDHAPAESDGVIETWLCSDPKHRQRMMVARPHDRGAKHCATYYQVLGTENGRVLIRAKAALATRHQVRVHLASIGCPLVGDELYGGVASDSLRRHALHAERVSYPGSEECSAFSCRAPVPQDLADLTPNLVRDLRMK